MSRAFIGTARMTALIMGVVLAFGVLMGRLVYLHVWEQDRLGRIVERNRQKFEILEARRGNIVDAKGQLLATTRTVIELGLDPQLVDIQDRSQLLALSRLIQVPVPVLETAINNKVIELQSEDGSEIRLVRWAKLCDAIDEPTYQKVLAMGIKGLYGNRKFERTYPGSKIAAHALGFVNKEGKPCGGLEQTFDFYLRGQNGWRQTERDGTRRELAQFRSREVESVPGLHAELSIDAMVQHIIEKELEQLLADFNPVSATIIVSEPQTGYILGMANVPTFDPNAYNRAKLDEHRNRAITDVFEPGSTFKIVPICAALEQKLIELDAIIDCTRTQVEYRGRLVKLPKDHRPFDQLTVREVIARSSNRGVAHLACLMGGDMLYDYAKNFGYGELTGVALPGEVRGVVHPVDRWDGLTISRMPMGHAMSATPLQVHMGMSVLANKGVLMQPQLVRRVFDDSGKTVVDFSPRAKRRVVTSDIVRSVSAVLTETVSPRGTSGRAQIPGFEVAGKSGTSQKIINGHYSNHDHVASFSGFFPASQPRLVITVVVDDAKVPGVAWGSSVAAPCFKRVAEQLIQYFGLKPVENYNKMIAWTE